MPPTSADMRASVQGCKGAQKRCRVLSAGCKNGFGETSLSQFFCPCHWLQPVVDDGLLRNFQQCRSTALQKIAIRQSLLAIRYSLFAAIFGSAEASPSRYKVTKADGSDGLLNAQPATRNLFSFLNNFPNRIHFLKAHLVKVFAPLPCGFLNCFEAGDKFADSLPKSHFGVHT